MTASRRAERRIIAEAEKLFEASDNFPVNRFRLNPITGEVSRRWFRGDYAWLDNLIQAVAAYRRKGEHYACKPDIFEATYEPALSHPAPAHTVEDGFGGM